MRHRRPLLHRPTPRRSAEAGLLPMINVVFLLLIFFLIAARLTPPEAFPVTLPDAAQTGLAEDGRFTLLLGAEGQVGYGATTGQVQALADLLSDRAAWCSATDCTSAPPALLIRADSMAPATALPGLMRAIEGMGFADISLAVVPK